MKKPDDIYQKQEKPALSGRRKVPRSFRREWRRKYQQDPDQSGGPEDHSKKLLREARRTDKGKSQTPSKKPARRRKHKHPGMLGNQILWIATTLLLLGYLSFLVYIKMSQGDTNKKSPKTVKGAVENNTNKGEAEGAHDAVPSIASHKLQESIIRWKASNFSLSESRRLMEEYNYAEAAKHLRQVLDKTPDHAEALILLAQNFLAEKYFEKAEQLLLEVIDMQPGNEIAKWTLVEVLYERKNFKATIALADACLNKDPLAMDIHELIAKAYMETDKARKALHHFLKIVEVDPMNAVAANNLALAYLEVGEYDNALRQFFKMLKKDSSSSITYFNMASCYAKMGWDFEATDLLSKASELFGVSFVKAWVNSGAFDQIRNKASFKKLLLKIDPENQEAVPPVGSEVVLEEARALDPAATN